MSDLVKLRLDEVINGVLHRVDSISDRNKRLSTAVQTEPKHPEFRTFQERLSTLFCHLIV